MNPTPDPTLPEQIISGQPVLFKNAFDSPFLKLEYIRERETIIATWYGFMIFEDVKNASLISLEAYKLAPVHYVINDNRAVEGPWYDVNTWAQEEWIPRATALGLRAMAYVLAEDTYAALSAQELVNMLQESDTSLRTKACATMEEAHTWLQKIAALETNPTSKS